MNKFSFQLSIFYSLANILLLLAMPIALSLHIASIWLNDSPGWFQQWGFYLMLAMIFLPNIFLKDDKISIQMILMGFIYIGAISFFWFVMNSDQENQQEFIKITYWFVNRKDFLYGVFMLGTLFFPVLVFVERRVEGG